MSLLFGVIPVKTGIQSIITFKKVILVWIPTYVGMTVCVKKSELLRFGIAIDLSLIQEFFDFIGYNISHGSSSKEKAIANAKQTTT